MLRFIFSFCSSSFGLNITKYNKKPFARSTKKKVYQFDQYKLLPLTKRNYCDFMKIMKFLFTVGWSQTINNTPQQFVTSLPKHHQKILSYPNILLSIILILLFINLRDSTVALLIWSPSRTWKLIWICQRREKFNHEGKWKFINNSHLKSSVHEIYVCQIGDWYV